MKKIANNQRLVLAREVVKTFTPIAPAGLGLVLGGRRRSTSDDTNTGCSEEDSGCGIRTA